MAEVDPNVITIYRAIEKFLRGEIPAMELVRTVDDAMVEYDREQDAMTERLDDFHMDVALFVADPVERRTDRAYIGPEELGRRAEDVKKSLDAWLKQTGA